MRQYTLFRSRRKTVGIHITEDAAVEVRAPLRVPAAEIERILVEKEPWISEHIARREKVNAARAAFRLDYGGTARLRGVDYPIRAREENLVGFDEAGFFLPPGLPPERIKAMLIFLYKKIAEEVFSEKTAQFAQQMGVSPARVTITSAKTRWGSCSGKNRLSFSWRLILAGEDAMDYVVVHELAHIREHNHSPRFWARVAAVLPDYAARREELKILQNKMVLEDWG